MTPKLLATLVEDKKIFKDFPFGCYGNQSTAWNETFHLRINSVKFHQIWPIGFKEEVVISNCGRTNIIL